MNPLGLITLQFVRPLKAENFDIFPRMRSLGFDFAELLVPEKGELDLADTRKALEDAGLGCVLAARVSIDRDIASARADARQSGIDYLRYCADVAEALGAQVVGGPFTGSPLVYAARAPAPVGEDERLARKERCVSALARAGDHLAGTTVRFAVEPLNRFESDVLCTTRQGLELIEAVGKPAIGLLLDTFHMHMEEGSIPESIRLAGPHVVHFQANENHRGFPGTGSTDWAAVFRALREIDYRGPVSLEPFRRNDDRFGVPIAQWRPPHENEDGKLKDAVAFLRGQMALAAYRR